MSDVTESLSSHPRHSVRRITRIAEIVGACSYLEVGIAEGKTFHPLQFERKVAVDPKFLFNPAEFARDGVEFHEIRSDDYFLHRAGEAFDIIFLDGLHAFPQAFRDFVNSFSVAHRRTVWLIDDVWPSDAYSAWPDRVEAVTTRRATGVNSGSWHGDVYKLLFAIHDFFPVLSYRTLEGANPQALVWQQPRAEFSPLFNSLEAIERLGYIELQRHTDILDRAPEESVYATLAQAYADRPPS